MTRGQVMVLNVLRNGAVLTAHEIADVLEKRYPGIRLRVWTYDRVHAILVRLEDRGYVQRFPYPGNTPSRWRIV